MLPGGGGGGFDVDVETMGVCASHDSCLQQIQAQTPRESNSKASAPRPCPDDRGTPTLCLCTSPINQVGPVPVHWAPKNSTAPGDCGTRWTLTVMVLPSGSPWVCSSSDLSLQSSARKQHRVTCSPTFHGNVGHHGAIGLQLGITVSSAM